MKKFSLLRTLIALAMAVFFGISASGYALGGIAETAFMTTLLLFSPMLTAFLYGFCGLLPAAVMAVSMLAGAIAGIGGMWPVYLLLGSVLPAAAIIYLSYSGAPFFRQLRLSLIAQAAGLMSVLALLFLRYGSDLGGAAADMLKGALDALTPEQQDALVNMITTYLGRMGVELKGTTAEVIAALIAEFEQQVKVNTPLLLVSTTAVNAILGVLWCNYQRARRGEDNVQFVSLRGWHLPVSTILGLTVCLIGTYLLTYTGSVESVLVFYAVRSAVFYAATIQAGASMLSRMKKSGVSVGKRTALFVIAYVFLNIYLVYYGILSAMFGSQGLLTPMIKARIEKRRKDKEDM